MNKYDAESPFNPSSLAWRTETLPRIKELEPLCAICRCRPTSQGHHLVYGEEQLLATVGICRPCHKRVTIALRAVRLLTYDKNNLRAIENLIVSIEDGYVQEVIPALGRIYRGHGKEISERKVIPVDFRKPRAEFSQMELDIAA